MAKVSASAWLISSDSASDSHGTGLDDLQLLSKSCSAGGACPLLDVRSPQLVRSGSATVTVVRTAFSQKHQILGALKPHTVFSDLGSLYACCLFPRAAVDSSSKLGPTSRSVRMSQTSWRRCWAGGFEKETSVPHLSGGTGGRHETQLVVRYDSRVRRLRSSPSVQ
ncbi:hypothetical protein GGX14DRAFT_577224 [Mycena pura]|uniref:Uncharacterized protein n=1 Tax=Mycena pura TaxID=153505 RepID=A0AAD6USB8_9AGAR|nr:hypothetical protein GGX14DRAFT_577224 [Mycena pura]